MKFDILEFVGARKRVDAKNAKLNPYNQLEKYKGKYSKERMNDILNGSRNYIVKIQAAILDDMRKDRSVTGEEIKAFAQANPLTWSPEKIKRVMIELNKISPELSKIK